MEINVELEERETDTKNKSIPDIIIYQIDDINKHFNENLKLLQDQFPIADHLVANHNIDAAKTIWRTQIVLLASAYDYFMHEIIWFGLFQMFNQDWAKSDGYNELTITLAQLDSIQDNPEDSEWFKKYITDKYSSDTMMSFAALKKTLKLLNIPLKEIADKAFYQRGCTIKTETQLTNKLNAVYYRRNHIAHQSDRSHENAEQMDITKTEVENFVQDIQKIVNAITEKLKTM